MDASAIDKLDLHNRSDAKLLEQAIRDRWPIEQGHKRLVLLKLLEAIKTCDPKKHRRSIGSLARAVAMLERQNQADEHRARPERNLNVNVTPEQLASMSDEELEALERRILGRDA